MGSCDAAEALAEGQRAARSATPEWGRATPQKLWPKANAQLGARPQNGVVRRRKRIQRIRPLAGAIEERAQRDPILVRVTDLRL